MMNFTELPSVPSNHLVPFNPAIYAGEWLAAIPIRFHVDGGPELRAAVAALAERLTAALGAAPGNERSQRSLP